MKKENKNIDNNIVLDETPTADEVTPVKKPSRSTKKVPTKGKVVNCELLNVREEASTKANVVKLIEAGTEIDILGEEGKFYKIADGFVMKSFIE